MFSNSFNAFTSNKIANLLGSRAFLLASKKIKIHSNKQLLYFVKNHSQVNPMCNTMDKHKNKRSTSCLIWVVILLHTRVNINLAFIWNDTNIWPITWTSISQNSRNHATTLGSYFQGWAKWAFVCISQAHMHKSQPNNYCWL